MMEKYRPPLSPSYLIQFEKEIADAFNERKIKAPIHLAGGNELDLIRIFGNVLENDWVCTQWRSHYHCLLKGVPPDTLKADILSGHSITLCYPEHRIISSAIVGGILPIALGLAWSIRRNNEHSRVWAFVGDMTAATGMFHECQRYARGHNLPIRFIIEDNGKSVATDTRSAWGTGTSGGSVNRFVYDLQWPHSGVGQRVNF